MLYYTAALNSSYQKFIRSEEIVTWKPHAFDTVTFCRDWTHGKSNDGFTADADGELPAILVISGNNTIRRNNITSITVPGKAYTLCLLYDRILSETYLSRNS